jgi:hypothetical protein
LEIRKWSEILEGMGHTCYYIAGECEFDPERSWVIPEAHFRHPTIDWINRQCFGRTQRTADVTAEIHEMRWVIKEKLHVALKDLELDLLIAENCVTIPMNLPLGLAIVGDESGQAARSSPISLGTSSSWSTRSTTTSGPRFAWSASNAACGHQLAGSAGSAGGWRALPGDSQCHGL